MKTKAEKMLTTRGYRYRLVNRKTGHLASSASWQVDLASIANQTGLTQGIGSLLPLQHAKRLARRNKLHPFKLQKFPADDDHSVARNALPEIRLIFDRIGGRVGKKTTATYLSEWIAEELQCEKSQLASLLKEAGHSACIDINRSARWWRDRISETKKSRVNLKKAE
jgi:hypothetical protein